MQTHTTFINKQETLNNIVSFLDNIQEKHNKFINSISYVYDYNLKELKLEETNTYHFYMDFLRDFRNTPFNNTLTKLLIGSIYNTEIVSGNSAEFVFSYFIELLKLRLIHRYDSTEDNSFEDLWMNKYKPIFEQSSNPITSKEQIYDNLSKLFINSTTKTNQDLIKAVYEAIVLAGLEGKIYIEPTYNKQSNYIVEMKNGYTFKSLEPFEFMLANKNKVWSKTQVKVLLVNGIIEEVAEIDHLLNKAYEYKQPLVMITLGYSEEVAATCKINNDNGSTDIQLLKIKSDALNINDINDVSVICGTTPVSALQGEIVSMIKWEDLPTIDRINISLKETNIENSKTQFAVISHIKNLLLKKQETIRNTPELNDDLTMMYDMRMKALSSNAVYVYLPDTSSNVELNSLKITADILLRLTKTLLQFGLVDINKVIQALQEDKDLYSRALVNTLTKIKKDKQWINYPLLSIALGFYTTTKNVDLIMNSSGFVITS